MHNLHSIFNTNVSRCNIKHNSPVSVLMPLRGWLYVEDGYMWNFKQKWGPLCPIDMTCMICMLLIIKPIKLCFDPSLENLILSHGVHILDYLERYKWCINTPLRSLYNKSFDGVLSLDFTLSSFPKYLGLVMHCHNQTWKEYAMFLTFPHSFHLRPNPIIFFAFLFNYMTKLSPQYFLTIFEIKVCLQHETWRLCFLHL